MLGPEMPRPGQVVIGYAHRVSVSIAEYPRTEVVGVSRGDALNLDDGHRSTLMGRPRRQRSSTPAPAHYPGPVGGQRVPGGVVHKLPADLRQALVANATALDAWKDITPLARNEFICWVEDAKQESTRERRIRRTQEELEDGQRRPCCWPGCNHRDRTGK